MVVDLSEVLLCRVGWFLQDGPARLTSTGTVAKFCPMNNRNCTPGLCNWRILSLVDISGQFEALLLSLEKQILQREEDLSKFRVRAEQYCADQEAEIAKAKARVEIIRAEMTELMREPLVDNPLASTTEAKAPSGTPVNQSDRIREAAKTILAEAGEPVMQLELKRRMESKGIHIYAKNPVDLIRSALRRDPDFKHIHTKGWTLTSDAI